MNCMLGERMRPSSEWRLPRSRITHSKQLVILTCRHKIKKNLPPVRILLSSLIRIAVKENLMLAHFGELIVGIAAVTSSNLNSPVAERFNLVDFAKARSTSPIHGSSSFSQSSINDNGDHRYKYRV